MAVEWGAWEEKGGKGRGGEREETEEALRGLKKIRSSLCSGPPGGGTNYFYPPFEALSSSSSSSSRKKTKREREREIEGGNEIGRRCSNATRITSDVVSN